MTENDGQTISIDTNTPQQVVIHCHGDAPTINIDVKHYHYPEWLDIESVLKIVREIKKG